MKIHFCDLCNESVPQSDLDEGRSFLRKGRVICAKCNALMSSSADETSLGGAGRALAMDETLTGEDAGDPDTKVETASKTAVPPASAAERTQGVARSASEATNVEGVRARGPVQYRVEGGGGLVAGFLAAVAVVLVAVVSVMLMDRVEQATVTVDQRVANVQTDMAASESELDARLDDLKSSFLLSAQELQNELEASLAERQTKDGETAATLQGILTRLDELDGRLAGLTEAEILVADHARALVALESGLAGVRLDLAQLSADLEARPVVVAAPATPVSEEPAWLALTEDLDDPNSGVRWNTVADLGHTGDPAVVPYIVPVLRDEDTFVRMEAARVLGNFEGVDASIGPLIDALADDAEVVRDAAVVSLRKLTGENFRYDSSAKESERTKRARAWRDWWEKQEKA